MRGVRGSVAAVIVLLAFGPPAVAAARTIVFERPSRVDRPGRGSAQARQNTPQVAETSSGPLVVWEDDRDVRLRYVSAVRRGDAWREIDPRLDRVSTTFASDGDGTAWALADSRDGVTTRSTRDGRTWKAGPRLIGAHASRHVVSAAGHDGRLLVARAALDEENCGRVRLSSNMPSAARRGAGAGVHVGQLARGSAGKTVTLSEGGRYVDVDAAIDPSGTGWVAAATLHGLRLYSERSPGLWEPEVVPPVIPAASVQRVRIAPTETEVVVIWQLLRGKDREVVSRAFRLASQTWGEPRVLGSHDGTPTLDVTVAPPDERGQESSVVAAWVSANQVAVAERNRRMWWLPPPGGGGLPETVAVATVDGRATLAFAARRVDGSTSQPYGAPNTDVFVRTRSGEGHWEPGERVDRDVGLVKRPGEPRVWTSDRDAFVSFDDDAFGGGVPVVVRSEGSSWSAARSLVVDGEPGEIVLVARDGSRVLRVEDMFVFQDASGRTFARVDDVGRENDVVSTGAGTFAAASIVGDPGRGEDQRFEIHEVSGSRDRVTRLAIGHATNLDLHADGRGGTELLTTSYNRGRETQRIVARHLRDGRLARPRTIAASVPAGHAVLVDDEGSLLVAWPGDDRITIERSDGMRRTIPAERPGYQFHVAASGKHLAIVFSSGGRLVAARSDGGRFTQLPLLSGRFAKIAGIGFGHRIVDYGSPASVCFAFPRPPRDGSGMTGWQIDLRVTERGRIAIAARHRADVIVARVDPDEDRWSYGEAGTRSKTASGDVAIDADGEPIVAWVDVTDSTHRVLASAGATSSRGAPTIAFGAAAGALALLGLALRLRRRAA